MELTHTFTVTAPVEQSWATFMDLALVGGCFPGATVTEVTDAGFAGTVKVRLGPIALVYAGSGAFLERDDSAFRAVIEAKGKDRRGNGTAAATVTIQLSEDGPGTTRAEVLSELAITGKPAQFGRGVMQDVSDKLLQQFIACVEGLITRPSPEQATGAAAAAAAVLPSASSESASSESASSESVAAPPVAPSPVAPPPVAPSPVAPSPVAPPSLAPSPVAPPPVAPPPVAPAELDLGATVLPVLLRTYGRAIAAVVVGLVLIVVVWRRHRQS